MVDLKQIQSINRAENYIVTMHGRRRMYERGILLRDVISAVNSGEIIEQYPDDTPFPSCLILGYSTAQKPVHAVISVDAGRIYLITAYYPDEAEWEHDWKARRSL